MLLLEILGYYRLFHFKLFLSIVKYFTLDYFWQFKAIQIHGYCWLFYWWLLVIFLLGLLVVINGYYINGYWWLLYLWLSMVIILMAIGGY
jgi:hypothetical protein